MLAVRRESESTVLTAVLVTDVSYNRFGEQILVKAGVEIVVDISLHIALIGSDHVEIPVTSYRLGLVG